MKGKKRVTVEIRTTIRRDVRQRVRGALLRAMQMLMSGPRGITEKQAAYLATREVARACEHECEKLHRRAEPDWLSEGWTTATRQ
ncbi:MAG: hypothetical protein AAB864_02200 [Patescibacteria group bacterium]